MEVMKIRACILLSMFFLTSCGTGSNENKKDIEYTYYADGSIKEEIPISSSKGKKILDGTVKTFYNNGRLRLTRNYKNGVKEGVETSYYKSGNEMYKLWYKKDLQDSIQLFFYDDKLKLLKRKSFWSEGVETGEIHEYFQNGKIKTFYYNNHNGETFFMVKYSENGDILSIEGHGIPEKYYAKKDYYIGDTLALHIDLVNPPLITRIAFIGELDSTVKFKDSTLLNTEEFNHFILPKILDKSGNVTYGLKSYLISDDTTVYNALFPIEIKK